LKEEPKVKKLAKFKSIRIPGSLPGPKPKGGRTMTSAERAEKSRADLRAAGAGSHDELVRESKLAPTAKDTKKKPGK
jgi:hypothetical protein